MAEQRRLRHTPPQLTDSDTPCSVDRVLQRTWPEQSRQCLTSTPGPGCSRFVLTYRSLRKGVSRATRRHAESPPLDRPKRSHRPHYRTGGYPAEGSLLRREVGTGEAAQTDPGQRHPALNGARSVTDPTNPAACIPITYMQIVSRLRAVRSVGSRHPHRNVPRTAGDVFQISLSSVVAAKPYGV